jgi:hypothetical protein
VSLLCRVFDFLVTQAMGAGGMRIVTFYQLAPRSKLLLMAFVNPKAESSIVENVGDGIHFLHQKRKVAPATNPKCWYHLMDGVDQKTRC